MVVSAVNDSEHEIKDYLNRKPKAPIRLGLEPFLYFAFRQIVEGAADRISKEISRLFTQESHQFS